MEAVFKIKAEEFDTEFIETLKGVLSRIKDGYVTVSIRENGPAYSEKLLRSRDELESGKNLISFTMEELEAYTASKKV